MIPKCEECLSYAPKMFYKPACVLGFVNREGDKLMRYQVGHFTEEGGMSFTFCDEERKKRWYQKSFCGKKGKAFRNRKEFLDKHNFKDGGAQ